MPHPYFAVTSAEATGAVPAGGYGIAEVPPGEYDVNCWHEGMRETPALTDGKIRAYDYSPDVVLTKHVKVGPGETVTLDFDVPAPPDRIK